MQKLYELKTDESGNEYIEWEYAGDRFRVVTFANKYKFLKWFKDDEKFDVLARMPRPDDEDAYDWGTVFCYGTILMEKPVVERMLQVLDYYRSLSHSPALVEEEKREPILPRLARRRATLGVIVGGVLLAVFGVLVGLCYLR